MHVPYCHQNFEGAEARMGERMQLVYSIGASNVHTPTTKYVHTPGFRGSISNTK